MVQAMKLTLAPVLLATDLVGLWLLMSFQGVEVPTLHLPAPGCGRLPCSPSGLHYERTTKGAGGRPSSIPPVLVDVVGGNMCRRIAVGDQPRKHTVISKFTHLGYAASDSTLAKDSMRNSEDERSRRASNFNPTVHPLSLDPTLC